jgi:hypothetical protein
VKNTHHQFIAFRCWLGLPAQSACATVISDCLKPSCKEVAAQEHTLPLDKSFYIGSGTGTPVEDNGYQCRSPSTASSAGLR